jgi:hypothetical protein
MITQPGVDRVNWLLWLVLFDTLDTLEPVLEVWIRLDNKAERNSKAAHIRNM